MTFRKIGADSFITKDHVEAHDSVLWVLGPLKEHVDVDVLNQIKLFLRAFNFIITSCEEMN